MADSTRHSMGIKTGVEQTQKVIEAFKQKYPEKEVTEDNLIEFTMELYSNGDFTGRGNGL